MIIEKTVEDCSRIFEEKYGTLSVLLSAPGRANVIGEHTDYNQGYVLPFAINKYIHFAAAKSTVSHSRIFAANLDEEIVLHENNQLTGPGKFLQACLDQLGVRFPEHQFRVDAVFGGNLPIGAGMSSSSALCCGFLLVLSKIYKLDLNAENILKHAIAAERGVAVEGGIMDQYAIINGKVNQVILLDCLDNSAQHIPFDLGEYCFCLIDSGVSHNLQETAYDDRVRTCKAGLANIQKIDPSVRNFRDVTLDHLEALPALQNKRLRHVINENRRVLESVEFLKTQNLQALGKRLYESHVGLRDLYEVSCTELNFIVEYLQKEEAVLGARMMGGGFGGSAIALLRSDSLNDIKGRITEAYQIEFNLSLLMYAVKASAGLINT